MTRMPTQTLPTGDELPQLGFGTYALDGEETTDAVSTALEAGYTHIDTAEGYENEAEVGDAIADVDREELFLTSKVLPKHLGYDSLIQSCEASLDRLGTDYLDLYLIHWPNPAVSLRESLDAMETLVDRGLVRNVGVSNFTAYQLDCAQHISDVPIAVNQIEFHPWFQRPDLVEFCQEAGVVVEAAAPLARAEVFEDDLLQDLAETYDRSIPQIVVNWALQHDIVALPKSSSPSHIRENLDVFDWELDAEDLAAIDERDREYPVYDTLTRDWSNDTYGIPR
ncbi:MAG: aldo/keto reductase [Halovenus sp.]